MPTLTELQTQRGELATEARAALNEITANTDESRTTELEQRHDAIMANLDKLDAKISARRAWRRSRRKKKSAASGCARAAAT